MKSRNVHSEIVFSLGANNNVCLRLAVLVSEAGIYKLTISCAQIAQSLRTFGITATTSNLLAIKLSTDPSITSLTVSQHLSASINGTLVEFSDMSIASTADIARIKKLYKLGGIGDDGNKGKRRRKDGKAEGSDLIDGLNGRDKSGGAERERKELEVAILGLMALRGAV